MQLFELKDLLWPLRAHQLNFQGAKLLGFWAHQRISPNGAVKAADIP